MIQNKLIGLTGGIATGKSTVTDRLRTKGYIVIDADAISRKALDLGTDAYNEVVRVFGKDILRSDGSIDRSVLGELIFKDKHLRDKLNSITHPYILKQISRELGSYKDKDIVFLDIPLLFEIKDSLGIYDIQIDETWLVYIDRMTQIDRLMNRDSIDLELAELKIDAQMDMEQKKLLTDVLIDNTGDKLSLYEQIDIALKKSHKD